MAYTFCIAGTCILSGKNTRTCKSAKYTKVKDATGFQVRYKLKGKWITKTFNVKKNATKAIKKLKKGKTYTVQVTYLKDTIKTTVKVK